LAIHQSPHALRDRKLRFGAEGAGGAHSSALYFSNSPTVGLADFGDKMPWQLSGGMQQRAQLCRALIHEPAILLLDEPFGALDAFTREELWGVLQDLWMRRKCTVILVTHELREAVYLCDTVHVVSPRPGRIIASRAVPFARPRTLDMTFQSDFVDLVQACRHHISVGTAT